MRRALGSRSKAACPPARRAITINWKETDFAFLLRLVDDGEAWLRPSDAGVEVQTSFQKSVTLNWRDEGGLINFKVRGRLAQPSAAGAQYDRVAMASEVFQKTGDDAAFTGSAARMVSAVVNQSKALFPPAYVGQRARAETGCRLSNSLEEGRAPLFGQ